jgi:CheY-like chemotaxis protein
MDKARILIVEDNHDNLTLMQDVLDSLEYAYLTAKDGEEAVRSARANRPDLILMDLSLPRMDGWTATKQLKADEQLAHIPIIALTAHAMTGDKEKALAAGCNAYLTKPLNLRELAGTLKQYLSSSDSAT